MDTPSEILEELRRHLLWQWEEGGRFILQDRTALRAANDVRRVIAADKGAASSAPAGSSGSLKDLLRKNPPAASAQVLRGRDDLGPSPVGEVKELHVVQQELGECTRCKLCSGRKSIVFGTGNPRAELVFVGEGPGAEEDLQGEPFVGPAGELLTKMIQAMGYSRDDVYICNVVKCRPPNNRNPEPDEIAACEPFLKAQLQAIRPKAIVALGKFAAQTLLRDPTPITRLRGTWREYQGIKLMPTFHPAYLLRTPAAKKEAWADLLKVMAYFGKAPKTRT